MVALKDYFALYIICSVKLAHSSLTHSLACLLASLSLRFNWSRLVAIEMWEYTRIVLLFLPALLSLLSCVLLSLAMCVRVMRNRWATTETFYPRREHCLRYMRKYRDDENEWNGRKINQWRNETASLASSRRFYTRMQRIKATLKLLPMWTYLTVRLV